MDIDTTIDNYEAISDRAICRSALDILFDLAQLFLICFGGEVQLLDTGSQLLVMHLDFQPRDLRYVQHIVHLYTSLHLKINLILVKVKRDISQVVYQIKEEINTRKLRNLSIHLGGGGIG